MHGRALKTLIRKELTEQSSELTIGFCLGVGVLVIGAAVCITPAGTDIFLSVVAWTAPVAAVLIANDYCSSATKPDRHGAGDRLLATQPHGRSYLLAAKLLAAAIVAAGVYVLLMAIGLTGYRVIAGRWTLQFLASADVSRAAFYLELGGALCLLTLLQGLATRDYAQRVAVGVLTLCILLATTGWAVRGAYGLLGIAWPQSPEHGLGDSIRWSTVVLLLGGVLAPAVALHVAHVRTPLLEYRLRLTRALSVLLVAPFAGVFALLALVATVIALLPDGG